MATTEWKVTVGALTTVALVSGGFAASIVASSPGPLPRITIGGAVAAPNAPASSGPSTGSVAASASSISAASISASSISAASAPGAAGSFATPGSPD